ncbi:GNAT family N-acetyltransferase [uncultured Mailhella sp.]|uniref:GNAT family N-acetyltransferase n=1 Tax=uncultured Mailhella sp. TaxID=1981031 RepID=UPI00262FFE5F|nr:GNAT family N-acetyltransferase [uncultured Mailhella sp.]
MNVIRWLTLKDMPLVAELEALCFPTAWCVEQFIHTWNNGFFAAYGSFLGETLTAYITLSVSSEELEVLNIAVLPKYRGQGLSRPLMGFALADTLKGGHLLRLGKMAKGWECAFLEVRPSNVTALSLYASLGFRCVGRRKQYYEDGEDALVYSLEKQDFLNTWHEEKQL